MPHIVYIFFLGAATGVRSTVALAMVCWLAWARLLPVHGWAVWTASLPVAVGVSLLALGEAAWATRSVQLNRQRDSPWMKPGLHAWSFLGSRFLFAGLVGAVGAGCVYQPAAGGVVGAWAGVAAGLWLQPRLHSCLLWVVGPGWLPSMLESTAALWLAFAFAVQLSQTSRALLRAPFI